jgi:hypothetical protein
VVAVGIQGCLGTMQTCPDVALSVAGVSMQHLALVLGTLVPVVDLEAGGCCPYP